MVLSLEKQSVHLPVDGNVTCSSKAISTYEMQQQEHLNPPDSLESLLPLQKAMPCITISAQTSHFCAIPDVCRGHFMGKYINVAQYSLLFVLKTSNAFSLWTHSSLKVCYNRMCYHSKCLVAWYSAISIFTNAVAHSSACFHYLKLDASDLGR